MSYSFDSDGWELFTTPFSSTSTRTAPASSTHHAERPQQRPSEASPHNTTPPAAQRNPLPTQKAAPPVRQTADTQQKPLPTQQPKPVPSTTVPVPDEKPAVKTPVPTAPTPAQTDSAKQEQAAPPKALVPTSTQPTEPQKDLVLDMSSGAAPAPAQDDTERRKAHEAAEAKRKAEWEAKQAAKKQAEEAAIQKLNDMSDADAIEASIKRIGTETERLTRRNMKECVAEHIQELCRKDTEFARKTMHPRKSMVKCFKYINRMAKEYVKQEMEDNDIQPDGGGYGCDVPDGLCYQWAEDYFNSTDAPEDREKEEKFTPKPYTGTSAKATKKEEKKSKKKQDKPSGSYEQISLEGVM